MIPAGLRAAFEAKVEDLAWEGAGVAPLLERAQSSLDARLLAFYQRAAAPVPSIDPALLARCAAGTLGHACAARLRDAHGGDPVREIWRVLLGYPPDVFGDWSLAAFSAAQQQDLASLLWIDVLAARVAFVTPEATIPVYDCITEAWLRGRATRALGALRWDEHWERPLAELRAQLGVPAPTSRDDARVAEALPALFTPAKLPSGLAALFWEMVETPLDSIDITAKIAAYGAAYTPELREACARAVLRHDGQRELRELPLPPRLRLEDLVGHAEGTLGYVFHRLLVDNGYDIDILDPASITDFHPVIDGVNRRILQSHDVWHLVAGYSTSPLQEVAITGFQLAQFGHHYSADFLATVWTLLTLSTPLGVVPAIQVAAEGWQHGRRTPALMRIRWHELWGRPIDAIRREFGIEPFRSAIPDIPLRSPAQAL